MTVHKIGSIEVFEIDQNIDQYTRKQREKQIENMFRNQYQGKEITLIRCGNSISALINRITRNNHTVKRHSHNQRESNLEYKKRQDLTFSGDYLELISDLTYVNSQRDNYPSQSRSHTTNTVWHYFKKEIICQNHKFKVILDVRENDGRYTIYNTKLKEVPFPPRNQPLQNMLATSSVDIIANQKNNYNQNDIQIEWINNNILKIIKEFKAAGVTVSAVYKTIKKEVNYYIEYAGDTKLIKKNNLTNDLINEFDEIMEEECGIDRNDFDDGLQI